MSYSPNEKFRKIFDHSNDAILLMDPEKDAILDANVRACQMLGYSEQEMRVTKISDVHPVKCPG